VSYLVEGDDVAAGLLSQAGAKSSAIATLQPGDEVFLLRPRSFREEVLYSRAFHRVAEGMYLATVAKDQVDGLETLSWPKARLMPGAFPVARGSEPELAPEIIVAKPRIQGMVDAVQSDTIRKYISQLSGHEPVVIGGVLDTLLTRYSYNWRFGHAAQYIYERFSEDPGLDVAYENYVICSFDFYGTCFTDAENGWAVGSTQKIMRTRDGGASWARQPISASNAILDGVAFVDTLTGWICDTYGQIYKTTDGGNSWVAQSSGASQALREIFFLDSQNGWVAGYGGVVRRTVDGGTTWTGTSTGTTSDLYGCYFRSNNRGWVVGTGGVIRYWDGTSWSGQTSGTTQNLLDVDFINGNVGWAVGGGWVLLKTVDGGLNWIAQPVPTTGDPYFKGVCFVDSLEGWVVGLNGTVLHTIDSGATWEAQESGTLYGYRRVKFVTSQEGWAVGYGGTIIHTSNGGATWENQRGNLPAQNLKYLKNIVATKPGTVSAEQVIICGHADDTSQDYNNLAPGADDNGSGTAAAIEAARVMASSDFKRTIKFIAFSGEEQGLYGSGEYAAAAKARGDVIKAVLNFDMIGYVDVAPEDIDVIGNNPSTWLVDFTIDCANAYVPDLLTKRTIDPNESGSDHYMFWQAGYNAILSIEDESVPYPYYHTTNDTLGNITMPFCTDVVKMGVAAVAELAEPDTVASVPWTPAEASRLAAWPNPFDGTTRVSFATAATGMVTAGIYD
ncbi:MAG TPA: M20/M25/M40 family metallo-hydrolase, partial [bacterium]|nr:M20/M25/M40 family metallo-hydrolase [bacterium]